MLFLQVIDCIEVVASTRAQLLGIAPEVERANPFGPTIHYIPKILRETDRICLVRKDNTKSRKDLPPNPSGFFMWWRVSSTLCGHQHHFLHRKVSGHFVFTTGGWNFASRIVACYPDLFQEIAVAVTMEDQLRLRCCLQ